MVKNLKIGILIAILLAGFNPIKVLSEEQGVEQAFIEELQAKIKLLESQIKRLEKEKEDTLKKYNKCMEDRIADSTEIKNLTLQVSDEKKKLLTAAEESEKKQAELKKQIDALNETIKKKDESIKDVQTQLMEKVKTLKEKTDTIEMLNNKLSQIEPQLKQLQSELEVKKSTIAKLQEELNNTQKNLDAKTQENMTLTANFDKEKQTTQQLIATLTVKENELTKLQTQLSATENELSERKKEVASYQAREDEIEKNRQEIEKEKANQQNLTQELTTQVEDNKKLYAQYMDKIRDLKSQGVSSQLFIEEGRKYQNYADQLYNLDLNKINELTISELNYYIANYPELEKADEYQYLIGSLYQEEGQNYEACAAYLKLIALYPKSKIIPKAESGIKQLEKKFPNEFYEKIKKLPSSKPDTRLARFFSYLKDLHELNNRNLYQYCLEQQQKFLEFYPDSKEAVEVYWLMAETYQRLKQDYKAIASYLKITQIYPSYPEVSRLADAYYAVGDTFAELPGGHNNAITFYEKAIALLPQYKKSSAYLLICAQLYRDKLKQPEKTISTYKSVVSTYPRSQEAPIALSELGNFYEKKQPLEAIKIYDQLVKEYPKNSLAPQSLVKAGECYEKVKDYVNAVATYLRLIDEYPDYEETPQRLFNAGNLTEKELNDVNKAMEIYEKIINKYPANEFAKQSEGRIKRLNK